MSGVNRVIIVGRLGNPPESHTFDGGKTNCRLSVATSEEWKDKDGNKQERTEWHNIVVWGPMAVNCQRYLKKGSMVYVDGRLQTRSWETDDGQKRYTTEIIASSVQFLSSPTSKDSSAPKAQEPEFNSNEEIAF